MAQLGNYRDSMNELIASQSINELMHSMKAMNMNAIDQAQNTNPMWMDSFAGCDDQQSFFVFSPSTLSPCASGSRRAFPRECNLGMNNLNEERSTGGPDLNWVNDLLT